MEVFSLFRSVPQEKELTGFITDFLQEAYIPAINGEGSNRLGFCWCQEAL